MADPTVAHSLYDTLKDFQPLIAASVAAIAAAIAYFTAMARVHFDRETRDIERVRQHLGLLLWLQAVAARTAVITRVIVAQTATEQLAYKTLVVVTPKMTAEFDDAWKESSSIPIEAFKQFERSRYFLEFARQVIAAAELQPGSIDDLTIENLILANKEVHAASAKLAEELDAPIGELRKKLR
jgi:hypothetical protein